jgi:electron transfer flavoprotein alpha subunit
LLATIANPKTRPQIATVRPGALRLPLPDKSRSGSVESIPVSLVSAIRTEVVETVRGVRERVPLEKARIIVSVGRGMGDQKGLDLAKELAEVLGAEVGGTRGALDEGLIDQAKWIGGAGGKRVKPDLYIACGISGAIQHYLGIKDAKYIVAINKNPRAPIFKLADVGIVGDVKQVLPALIAELKAA